MTEPSSYPTIVNMKNKYGIDSYVANNEDELNRAYFAIIKNWVRNELINNPEDELYIKPLARDAASLSQEQVDALPPAMREEMKRLRKDVFEKEESLLEDIENYAATEYIADFHTFSDFAETYDNPDLLSSILRETIDGYSDYERVNVYLATPLPLPE